MTGSAKAVTWQGSILKSTTKPLLGDRYLRWLGWLLVGYALAGRSFAYIGYPPLFIGEIALVSGLWALGRGRGLGALFRHSSALWLAAFMLWGALRTVPYIDAYGAMALRDGALWGYGIFVFIVGGLVLDKPRRLLFAIDQYRRFVRIFILCIPFIWGAIYVREGDLPLIPVIGVPLVSHKAGDILVHLGGATAFIIAGLAQASLPLFILLVSTFILTGIKARSGMLSYLAAFGLASGLRPTSRAIWQFTFLLVGAVVLVGAVDLNLGIGSRSVSYDQIMDNVLSVFGQVDRPELNDTKSWRLEWWNHIIDYTVRGDYFWTGKGFGVNLADVDGFQVTEDSTLRSPHNAHLTILARSGVPGAILWFMVQISWAFNIFMGYLRARMRRDGAWPKLFIWLLAYWLAFMVNATFDVYLEGPMGGIWFWSLYGLGLAALTLHERCPQLLTTVTPGASQATRIGLRVPRQSRGRRVRR